MERLARATGWKIWLFGWLCGAQVWALDGVLKFPDGTPAAGVLVSVVGSPGSVTTDAAGHFRLIPDPPLPCTLVVSGAAGEVFAPIEVSSPPGPVGVQATLVLSYTDSVTVAAGVAPTIDAPPAAATVLLGREDLEQRRPQHLVDALQGVAGASRVGEGATAVPVLRGMARGRTLLLLDGARITSERRAGPSASFLDPFSLGSVEVARGPGSVSYGSDAFGGVISARTPDPEPGPWGWRYDANGFAGGSDERSAGLQASGGLGAGALQATVHGRKASDGEAGGGEEIFNSAFEDWGAALRYLLPTAHGRVRVAFAAFAADQVGKPASDARIVKTRYPEETSRRFTLGWQTARAGFEDIEVGLFLGSYRLVTDRDRLPTASALRRLERSDVDANDGSLRVSATRGVGSGRLQTGVEVVSRFDLGAISSVTDFDASGGVTRQAWVVSIAEARRVSSGLFASYDLPLAARVTLSTGARADRVDSRNRGGFFGDFATSHDALSGHAAVTAGPFRDFSFTAQVARGFRDPSLSDRFFRGTSGRGLVTGNPQLDPERSLQFDGSTRYARGGHALALYSYLYRISDLIERYRGGADFFFRNRGEAELRGLELESRHALPAGFAVEFALSLSRGEDPDSGEPIADIASAGGWATLRWANEKASSYLRWGAFSEDDRPGPTEVRHAGYSTLDLGATWRFSRALELRLIGRNLTDRHYRESPDEVAALAPGRAIGIGISGRL